MSEFKPLLPKPANNKQPPANPANNTQTPANNTTTLVTTENSFRFPGMKTLMHVIKMAITEDKPIILDYWTLSLEKMAMIGLKEEDNEKLLVKNEEEYTSPIQKIIKIENDYVITTENSIYLVDCNISKRKISG